MARDYIDVLAFTGHKDMYGFPGVGGLCSHKPLDITPLIQGGTGIHGEDYTNPPIFPEALESGTLNMPAIWSLVAALDYLRIHHDTIADKEERLTQHIIDGLLALDNVIVYKPQYPRVSTICFNVKGLSSSDVVSLLDKKGICVRGGIHCAILAHETLGTVKTGAVRASLNYLNTDEEIDFFLHVLGDIK